VVGLFAPGYSVAPSYVNAPILENRLPFRRYFRKVREGRRTRQIHLVERSNVEWWKRHLLFRDHLRAHPETTRGHGRLKDHLAERFRADRDAYTDAKTHSILEVIRRAREDRHS